MPFDAVPANGFGCRHLHLDEAWALFQAGYLCPPDMRVPGPFRGQGSWHLSPDDVLVPPIPEGVEREYAIADVRRGLTPEQAADPRWRAEDNAMFWQLYFQCRHGEELADRGDNDTVEGCYNSKGRKRWWSALGRNLGFVLAHIAGGNEPRLIMPPRSSWLPWRMVSPSSSGTCSSSDARWSGGSLAGGTSAWVTA